MNPLIAQGESRTTSPVVVALDFADADGALAFASRLDPAECRLKVGKELFTSSGRHLVESLAARGFQVFLDMKFHDIPNTVAQACKAAAESGVWMVNVHASGGRRMMEAAREALAGYSQRPLLIAVTVLTSMEASDLAEVGIAATPQEHVLRLATLTRDCGLDGVVCSAQEAAMLKLALGRDFKLVTPGIRLADSAGDDQRRVMTPTAALAAGSDYLVIGRPITRAADPLAALRAINQDISVFLGKQS
ncbi:orotidine-5'-phosphate decarboxylase [Chromobacterium violaceum]|uniref:Orotidine 5'-phosphate decarboxylase n=2 Tax=Chromobacterium violaceum TaxID=536 RepID=PYRF_CHRVO|nr:orotidine-5'-phosphate decarboxylase [Chromobacterium violaceum]Q7NTL2.1 RecName: Full=Orotidine 5'-phosphate decarboxylase; AltName: Full=OMP decarboxylase; Short=OMPDCase; Short=OMPdecase [Chromobacterium violaceum ATCC 12472]AAQ60711.1 orotidine 5`-phosphate decarboxylase [Chromobacterium violaceum ATCC 12472]MBA8736835.1 orotidine-5'-phosphate decarboxylase [Chromobacterium violaceum]MBP4048725.1 orotidine-5'-phosphate decarboxylase [Chromobacterium violaceum]MCD0492769.1 orotidine-5'-p